MRDPVVPAERVFVEENPGISHAQRKTGEATRQRAPAAQGPTGGSAVEAGQFKAREAQSRSARPINNQQILVGRPEQAWDSSPESQHLNLWRTHRSHLPEDETEERRRHRDDQSIDQRSHEAPAKRGALQRNVDAGPLFGFFLRDCFDGNSAQRRRRRRNLRNFQNSRTLTDRFGQLIGWGRRWSPGRSRKLDNLRPGRNSRILSRRISRDLSDKRSGGAARRRGFCRRRFNLRRRGVRSLPHFVEGEGLVRYRLERRDRCRFARGIGSRRPVQFFKLQAQRRISRRTHPAACAITAQSGREFITPRRGSLRRCALVLDILSLTIFGPRNLDLTARRHTNGRR
jgi:hypothetical protein